MVGGMLSATDPVAVVAILKELGIAESLSMLIEGESLLNDGTAIVVFSIFSVPIFSGAKLSPLMVRRGLQSVCPSLTALVRPSLVSNHNTSLSCPLI